MPPIANQPGEVPQDQMRVNLQDLMSKIEGKYQDFNSQKFASDNKLKVQQGESLRQVFDLLESMGIDPSNVEQVREFLARIKESNPELSSQLEIALGSILGDEAVGPEPITEGEPLTNMNININDQPQENI